MNVRTLLGAACVMVLASTTIHAEVYRWADSEGNIHYGDRKPDNQPSVQLNIRAGKPIHRSAMAPSSEKENSTSAGGVDPSSRLTSQAGSLTAEQLRSNCDIVRRNLKAIETSSRIRITEKGEQRYLTPEEIEAKRLEMQTVAAQSCHQSVNTGATATL